MKISFIIAAAALGISGCASYFSARDAHLAREYLTEDIEDQILFNLIRAANGLPFAHYDVSTVQSIVTDKLVPSAGGSRNAVSSGFEPGAVVTSALHMVTRTLNAGVGAERDNAVTVNVGPIFNDPKIYQSYVAFLNLRKKSPGELRAQPSPAPLAAMNTIVSEKDTDTTNKDKDGKVTGTIGAVEKNLAPEVGVQPINFQQVTLVPVNQGDGIKIDYCQTNSLRATASRPLPTAYIPNTLRRWGNCWYYIPVEYRPEFSDLCISLTARTGKPAGGGTSTQEDTAKALQQLNSQLMQQNSLSLPK
jgi:hypothetical protein